VRVECIGRDLLGVYGTGYWEHVLEGLGVNIFASTAHRRSWVRRIRDCPALGLQLYIHMTPVKGVGTGRRSLLANGLQIEMKLPKILYALTWTNTYKVLNRVGLYGL